MVSPIVEITLSIPVSEGGLIVRAEFNESDTKFLYTMKLVSPKASSCTIHLDTTRTKTLIISAQFT